MLVHSRFRHWNWSLLDQALVSGTNFAVGIVLVRQLGVEQYGTFVLGWMVVQFVISIQNALIILPMLSISPKTDPLQRNRYYTATFILQVALALLTCAASLLLAILLQSYTPDWLTSHVMLGLMCCLVFMQFHDYLRRNLFSRLLSKYAFSVDLIAYGAQLPLLFVIVQLNPSIETALYVIAGTMSLSLLFGCRWLNLAHVDSAFVVKVTCRHWLSSKWLLGSAILQWVSGNYFLMIAGAIGGAATVGAIRAAQNLLGLTHIFFQGLENVVPGEASQRFQLGGAKSLSTYVAKTALVLLLGTGLVAVIAFICAGPLLMLAYGALNQDSVTAMAWFVPIYILVSIGLPLRAGLRTLEATSAIFIAYIATAAFAVGSATYLVGSFSINGAMAGMLVVESIMVLVLLSSFTKQVQRS